jgi:hypothetical protein
MVTNPTRFTSGLDAFLVFRETSADTEAVGLFAAEREAVLAARAALASNPHAWYVEVRRFRGGRRAERVYHQEAGPRPCGCEHCLAKEDVDLPA